MAPRDLKPEAAESFNPKKWAEFEHVAASDPDNPSELEAEQDGVLVSVRSSSNWEGVTTPKATFWGVPRVARAVGVGVQVPEVTYLGWCHIL